MEKIDNIIINNYLDKYSLTLKNKNEFKRIINPIVSHFEFQTRLSNLFPHHGSITLGEHIIEDAVLTYKLSKNKDNSNYRTDLAVKIAMFHDLYTIPWQNNKETKVKHFFHKHGFRHPVEAVINAISWYPNYFSNINDSKIIIDGILHHMFPLPVVSFNEKNVNYVELKNYDLFKKLPKKYQDIIIESISRKKIGNVSLSRSSFIEGRIMAKADRIVSRKQIRDLESLKSLVTGKNKKIK